MQEVPIYFLLFITYAFIGWVLEVTCKFFQYRRFVNRGFLIGPYCPVYGCGALLMTIFLSGYKEDIIVLFGMSVLICALLEYTTSYLMEKIFKARWWDYSQYKFHINGRVCLSHAVFFGLGGVLIIKGTNPVVLSFLNQFPKDTIAGTALILFLFFLIDCIVSFKVMLQFKNAITGLKDNTEEMNRKVQKEVDKMTRKWKKQMSKFMKNIQKKRDSMNQIRDEKMYWITEKMKDLYKNKSYLYRRIVDAFPNFKASINEKRNESEITKSKRSKSKK